MLVTLDGHDPAPFTAPVVRAAFLAAVETSPTSSSYTEAVARARAVLATADIEAAMREPTQQTRTRDQVARERRRRLAAERDEQARLRADLVAALDAARRSG
ncbi:hypothetical protein GCM10009609_51240 [Pseudonocardia aurantiaca]|uniref:Uncharacterized protein n=1 Tax=Pseudonocardia aurantiaca TaxID=75290 RepID=A0ABW4FT52_9PSEU